MPRKSVQLLSDSFQLCWQISFNYFNITLNVRFIKIIYRQDQYRGTYLKSVNILFVSFLLLVLKSEGRLWFCSLLRSRSFQLLFTTFAGRFPMYCPFISLREFRKSRGWANDTNPYPFVFPVLLSLTTLAMLNEGYRVRKALAKT